MDKALLSLYKNYTGKEPVKIELLAGEGSSRCYYRLYGETCTSIGTVGTSAEENRAFFALSRHLKSRGLPVPELLAVSQDERIYLQEDLGDVTLYDFLRKARDEGEYDERAIALLCSVMRLLPDIQFLGADGLETVCCYPSSRFDERLVHWDLNYFKYDFLKAVDIDFNESLLEDDFERLSLLLLSEKCDTFMYRDFQSRNIMLRNGAPWLIDFQGGRLGPLYYDVASFVGQSRANYPPCVVKKMLETYRESLSRYRKIEEGEFMEKIRYFMLFRTLQTLGAYGFRGLFERKSRFVESIPMALAQLKELLKGKFPEIPYLYELLCRLPELPRFKHHTSQDGLTVEVVSFSYRRGIPEDYSGNGGGFVFDCRAINNPGRYEKYRQMTGTDEPVIRFLEEDRGILHFLDSTEMLVDTMVTEYLKRGFNHIFLCFGCTGGQHRSVYSAEHTARHLARKFKVNIKVNHRELHREYLLEP